MASHSPVWFVLFTTSAKMSGAAKIYLTLPKYCKTFDSLVFNYVDVIHTILKSKYCSSNLSKWFYHCLFSFILGCQIKDEKKKKLSNFINFKTGCKTAKMTNNFNKAFDQEIVNKYIA